MPLSENDREHLLSLNDDEFTSTIRTMIRRDLAYAKVPSPTKASNSAEGGSVKILATFAIKGDHDSCIVCGADDLVFIKYSFL